MRPKLPLTFCGLAKVAVKIKLLKDWQGFRRIFRHFCQTAVSGWQSVYADPVL